jgi:hypothetical protein
MVAVAVVAAVAGGVGAYVAVQTHPKAESKRASLVQFGPPRATWARRSAGPDRIARKGLIAPRQPAGHPAVSARRGCARSYPTAVVASWVEYIPPRCGKADG